MLKKKRGPKPKGLVSIHMQVLATDLDYLRWLRKKTGKTVNAIIRELISGFVEMCLYTEKSKTVEPGERTPDQTVCNPIVAEIESAVKPEISAATRPEIRIKNKQ